MCKGVCRACPSSFSEEAEIVQNYGCLPEYNDWVRVEEEGGIISCHEDDNKPCLGFIEHSAKYKRVPKIIKLEEYVLIPNKLVQDKGVDVVISKLQILKKVEGRV